MERKRYRIEYLNEIELNVRYRKSPYCWIGWFLFTYRYHVKYNELSGMYIFITELN